MYTNNISHDTKSSDGISAYKQFREVYKLDIVQRQSGDSEEQKIFRDIFLRLRKGESDLNDWQKFGSRFEEKLKRTEQDRFLNVVSIKTMWDEVDRVNIDML